MNKLLRHVLAIKAKKAFCYDDKRVEIGLVPAWWTEADVIANLSDCDETTIHFGDTFKINYYSEPKFSELKMHLKDLVVENLFSEDDLVERIIEEYVEFEQSLLEEFLGDYFEDFVMLSNGVAEFYYNYRWNRLTIKTKATKELLEQFHHLFTKEILTGTMYLIKDNEVVLECQVTNPVVGHSVHIGVD